jgi:hypothetical protein
VNFPYIWCNIPAVPAYGVSISQLIRYFRACGSYQHFLDRELLLTRKPLSQRISWSHHVESCTVATLTWLTVTEHLVYRLTFFDMHDELTLSVRMDIQRCNIQRIAINPLYKHGCFIIFYKAPACFNMSVPPADPKLSVLVRMYKIILNKQQKSEKNAGRYQRVIISRKSKRDRQYNDQSRQDKRTNNLHNTTKKINDRATRTPLETEDELRYRG